MLIDSHTNEDNKVRIRANLPLEYIFGFCKTFKKITKGLGFELQLKTLNGKRNIIYTDLGFGGNDNNVTITSVYLYIYQVSSPMQNNNNCLIKQSEKILH